MIVYYTDILVASGGTLRREIFHSTSVGFCIAYIFYVWRRQKLTEKRL